MMTVAHLWLCGVVIVRGLKELRMAKPQDTVLTIDGLAEYPEFSKSIPRHLVRGGNVLGQKIGWHRWFHRDGSGGTRAIRERGNERREAIAGQQRFT